MCYIIAVANHFKTLMSLSLLISIAYTKALQKTLKRSFQPCE